MEWLQLWTMGVAATGLLLYLAAAAVTAAALLVGSLACVLGGAGALKRGQA
jgi:hypothetical protein